MCDASSDPSAYDRPTLQEIHEQEHAKVRPQDDSCPYCVAEAEREAGAER